MSLLLEISHSNITVDKVRFAYTANLAAALILLRIKDKNAAKLLYDDKHHNLRKYGSKSPLNHWGFFLFNSLYNSDSEKYLSDRVLKSLHKMAGRFVNKRIIAIHKNLSSKNNLTQDWELQSDNLKLVILRLESNESHIKSIANSIAHWNLKDSEEQIEAYNIVFYYLQRHDPQSKLLELLRNQIDKAMINANQQPEKKDMTEQNLIAKINLIAEQESGTTSTGVGASSTTASTPSTQTSAIASYPQRLFRNKVVIRRKRDYVKPKKFKLDTLEQLQNEKSVIIEWNDIDFNTENYSGFEQVKKHYHLAVSIVEHTENFPLVRITGNYKNLMNFFIEQYGEIPEALLLEAIPNDSAPNITIDKNKQETEMAAQIDNKFDKADSLVDTHVYGLESSDGKIVKVYVNVSDSETFEKELANNLSSSKDIEDVINDLANEFDIVSVDYPEGMKPTEASDVVKDSSSEQAEEDNPEEEEKSKFKLDFNISHAHKDPEKEEESKEGDSKEGDSKEDSSKEEGDSDLNLDDQEDKSADEEDLNVDDEKEGEEDADLNIDDDKSEDEDSDLNVDTDFDNEKGEEDSPENKKDSTDNKKKKKKKGNKEKKPVKESLLNELLEIVEDKKKDIDKEEISIEDVFKSPLQRKIVKLLFLLDFPLERFNFKKSLFRKSIRNVANNLSSIGQAKSIINKLIDDLSTLENSDKKYRKAHEFANMKEGVEEQLTNEMQLLLLNIFTHLGVPESVINYKKASLKNDIRKTARILNQHAKIKANLHKLGRILGISNGSIEDEEQLSEEVKISGDAYVNLIVNLIVELGIPEVLIQRNKMVLINAIKDKKPENLQQVRAKILSLYKTLQPTVMSPTNEDLQYHLAHNAENFGDWTVKFQNDKLNLSIKDVKLTIKDTDVFIHSIDNGLSTFIKDSDNKKWYFKSLDHGNNYVVICQDCDKYPNGILMKEKTIDKILSIEDDYV